MANTNAAELARENRADALDGLVNAAEAEHALHRIERRCAQVLEADREQGDERSATSDAREVPLLRAPVDDPPKGDGRNVVCLLDNGEIEIAVYCVGSWLLLNGDVLCEAVSGWCEFEDAADAMRKAVRHG